MAIALSLVHPEFPGLSLGNIDGRALTLTYSGTYATNGDLLTPGQLGLTQLVTMFFTVRSANGGTAVLATYNFATQRVMLYGGAASGVPLAELANATSVAALVIDVLAIGI